MNLRRGHGRPLVIGHRGAAARERENSRRSLEAAVAAGADIVEFDVSPGLRLGHSAGDAEEGLTLDEALELLAPHDVGLQIDLKRPGFEAAAAAVVRSHALEERTLFSTAYLRSARLLSDAAGSMPVAIGYPHDRHNVSRFPWPGGVVRPAAALLAAVMPLRIPSLLRLARADALALHHSLCSAAAIAAAHRAGVPVLAWTVNDPATMRRLDALGVDAIASDDPERAVATLMSP